jgi:hypothetical protein
MASSLLSVISSIMSDRENEWRRDADHTFKPLPTVEELLALAKELE